MPSLRFRSLEWERSCRSCRALLKRAFVKEFFGAALGKSAESQIAAGGDQRCVRSACGALELRCNLNRLHTSAYVARFTRQHTLTYVSSSEHTHQAKLGLLRMREKSGDRRHRVIQERPDVPCKQDASTRAAVCSAILPGPREDTVH